MILEWAARSERMGVVVTRIGLVVVLVWIGGLKAFRYEDEGIVPFVANSPVMSFLYRQPAGEYRQHMNREGELVPANREWHERNGTYLFAYGLGSVIVAFGVMIALHPWLPQVSALGSFLVFGMSLVTLSFLVTTPECWVPALGQPRTWFPAAVRRGKARRQGRHHGGCGTGHDGRLREGVSAESQARSASKTATRELSPVSA